MTTKTATKATATKATKATKAPATKAPSTKAKAAAEAKKHQSAMKATALELTPAQLVERITQARFAEDKGTQQAEHFRNLFEAAKVEASNQRVLLARSCYLLAAHPEVGGKAINYSAAARVVVGPEAEWKADGEDSEYGKAVDRIRVWLTIQAKAGAALETKGLVWNQGAPTEAERAIVEASHDATVRAASAKKNAKVRNKAAGKGKGAGTDKPETDESGIEKSKIETAIPTAEGIIAALETLRKNIAKFHAEARFSELEAAKGKEQVQLILADLMGFYPDEDAADVDA